MRKDSFGNELPPGAAKSKTQGVMEWLFHRSKQNHWTTKAQIARKYKCSPVAASHLWRRVKVSGKCEYQVRRRDGTAEMEIKVTKITGEIPANPVSRAITGHMVGRDYFVHFPSIGAAERAGYSRGQLIKSLRTGVNTCGGLIWKYANECREEGADPQAGGGDLESWITHPTRLPGGAPAPQG